MSRLENISVISYVMKKLTEDTSKQVGKTIIQKFGYLLSREKIAHYSYTMYHYGPFSDELSNDLEIIQGIGGINIEWKPENGYFIHPTQQIDDLIGGRLKRDDVIKIDEIIKKYRVFNAIELSIISTAFYIKDNFGIQSDDHIVQIVKSLKPQYSGRISNVLKKAAVIK